MNDIEVKYTIIIPHKNIPELLERCLKSIPNNKNIQTIVVDDASECIEKIQCVQQQFLNVEFYFEKYPKGAGHARNVGLQHAKGRWVVFSDSDDLFESNLLDILDSHYDDNADIIYFNARSVYSDDLTPSPRLDKRRKTFEKNSNKPTKINELCRYFFTEPWGKMIKHSLIKDHNIRFDETPLANDYFFSIVSGFYAKNIVYDRTEMYLYTERKGSLSNVHCGDENALKTRLSVYWNVQSFYEANNIHYIPFYRFSVWQFFNHNRTFSRIVSDFWKLNRISKLYVFYRYITGKIYLLFAGIDL